MNAHFLLDCDGAVLFIDLRAWIEHHTPDGIKIAESANVKKHRPRAIQSVNR